MSSSKAIEGGDPIIKTGSLEVASLKREMVIFDMSEKNVISAMEAITTDDIEKFVSKMEVIKGDDIAKMMMSLFDFMGFDPTAIIRKLIAVNKYYVEVKKLPNESEETLIWDIIMMICANIVMGNLQQKSIGRRSQKGRMALGYLIQKYEMRKGSTGAGLPSDVLTFPRVANSFPSITCRAAAVLPSKNFLSGPFKTTQVPKYMRVSAFASLCPDEMDEKVRLMLLEVVCAYSCDQLITVHEGEKKKRKVKKDSEVMSPSDAYSNQWDFIQVSSNSPVPSLKMKKAMLLELGVENEFTTLSEVVKNFRELLSLKDVIPTGKEFQDGISKFISQ